MATGLSRPLGRRQEFAPRIVGMDYISAAGAFNWPVPAGVDMLDIVAVGAGSRANLSSYNQSGAVAQRVGKLVVAGQIISGVVGNLSTAFNVRAGATTVDGMTADGGINAYTTPPDALAIGGDINLPGLINPTTALSAGIPTLTDGKSWNSPRLNNLDFNGNQQTVASGYGIAPGGSADGTGYTNNGLQGSSGGVIFVMYKLEKVNA